MSDTKKSIRLLIVGDNQFDIEETVRLSSSLHVRIDQAVDSEWAVEQFDKTPSQIVILCHSRVEVALKFYMSFLMFSKSAMDTPHQTILMCDGKESQQAYDLCKNQTIDDYVIYKPLYDIHRLKFCIELAMTRLELVNYQKLMEQRLALILEKFKEVKNAMKDQVEKSHRYQTEVKSNEGALEDIVKEGFDRLKGKLNELHDGGALSYKNKPEFDVAYNKFQDVVVDEAKRKQEEITAKNHDWISEMQNQFGKVSGDIEKTEEVDKSIIQSASAKILIVEDEVVNQKMMDMILSAEGFETRVAADGITALSIAEKWVPNVILMDIRMPKMNGLKVTQRLKGNPQFKNTVIIMLTAHSEKVVVRKCLKAGAADFIVKPAKKAELLERIEFFLGGGGSECQAAN